MSPTLPSAIALLLLSFSADPVQPVADMNAALDGAATTGNAVSSTLPVSGEQWLLGFWQYSTPTRRFTGLSR